MGEGIYFVFVSIYGNLGFLVFCIFIYWTGEAEVLWICSCQSVSLSVSQSVLRNQFISETPLRIS